MDGSRCKVIAIMGATATGKSDAAITLARQFGGEIVSMDSRQVYRRMDIGTGKVTPAQCKRAPHHLIDILDPADTSSAGAHGTLARRAVEEIRARGAVPFLVGGTGLYFRSFFGALLDVTIPEPALRDLRAVYSNQDTAALYEQLFRRDPQRAEQMTANDRHRITRALELMDWTGQTVTSLYRDQSQDLRFDPLRIVLSMPRALLHDIIARRVVAMFEAGWRQEVQSLLDTGVLPDAPGMQSLGYTEIAGAIVDGAPDGEVMADVVTRTRQYAKRQETFFRGEPDALWVDVSTAGWLDGVSQKVSAFLTSD